MADRLHPLTHVVEAALTSIRQQRRNFPAVIEWASPVPFFGQAERARIASVGLNPSGREFCDSSGRTLRGRDRRLATLDSLGLRDWSDAGPAECSAVAEACSGDGRESALFHKWVTETGRPPSDRRSTTSSCTEATHTSSK